MNSRPLCLFVALTFLCGCSRVDHHSAGAPIEVKAVEARLSPEQRLRLKEEQLRLKREHQKWREEHPGFFRQLFCGGLFGTLGSGISNTITALAVLPKLLLIGTCLVIALLAVTILKLAVGNRQPKG